jgi:Glycosyl hydrolase family 66
MSQCFLPLLVLAFLFLSGLAIFLSASRCRPDPPPMIPLGRTSCFPFLYGNGDEESNSNYAFVAAGFDDTNMPKILDGFMKAYRIKDVQFYDWFANYEGNKQTYYKVDQSNISEHNAPPSPNWWLNPTWKDPFFLQRTIRRDVLLEAIGAVKSNSGRAWAYVQSQASEDYLWTLSDSFLRYCFSPADNASQQVCFPYNNTCIRTAPYYRLNDRWAKNRCDAWAPIVHDFQFHGIHWDTGVFCSNVDNKDDRDGAMDFLKTAYTELQKLGLEQTFNDIDLHFGISANTDNFFGPKKILCFPYSEIWNVDNESKYLAIKYTDPDSSNRAVIAAYPGNTRYGCPVVRGCTDPKQLAIDRAEKYGCAQRRYCIIGIGVKDGSDSNASVGMLLTEYFSYVQSPVDGDLQNKFLGPLLCGKQ